MLEDHPNVDFLAGRISRWDSGAVHAVFVASRITGWCVTSANSTATTG